MRHLQVPQYDGLSIDHILRFLSNFPIVMQFLPEEKEIPKCPKQWIVNVAFAVVQDPFGHWVKSQIDARNHKVAVDKDLFIDMDPDVAAAFQ